MAQIEDEKQGLKLALLNIIGENAYQEYDVARYLVEVLKQAIPMYCGSVTSTECRFTRKRKYWQRLPQPEAC